jgi:hypothetical protein
MSKGELDSSLREGNLAPPILADDPVTVASELRDDLDGFARRLARVLERLPASSPVLIHGDWGIGKTSLLHAIERHAARRPVIWFHAWRYEREASLLPALLRQIWDSTPEAFRKKEENRSRYHKIWNAAVTLGTRLVPVILTALGAGAFASVVNATADGVAKDMESLAEKAREPKPDVTAELWKELTALVKDAWPGQRPLILVDDLDRCSPEGAVALLDGLRLLVTCAPPPVQAIPAESDAEDGEASEPDPVPSDGDRFNFVVALDRLVLVHAVSKKFEGIGDYDGNRYLEKIFPLSFAVPAPHDGIAVRLVETFLGGPKKPGKRAREGKARPGGEQQGGLGDQRDALNAALLDPLFANPRIMKRCINRFRLVRYFEEDAKVGPNADEDRKSGQGDSPESLEDRLSDVTLAKWIAATERWPKLRPLMLRQTDDYWSRLQDTISGKASIKLDVEAEAMVSEPRLSSWMRANLFPRNGSLVPGYRKAEWRLRKWGM